MNLFLTLLKQWQNFTCVYFTMIIVICLLIENKFLSLKPVIKMPAFYPSSVYKVYLINLMLLNLEKHL